MAPDPKWEEAHATEELGRYPPEHLIRWVHRYFPRGEGRSTTRLLDLGCGQGAGTWFLAREGFMVDAIDVSASAVAKTLDLLRRENLRDAAQVHAGDALNLVYDNSVFDGVVDILCACHHSPTDGLMVMREVARVLRPGGYLLSVWPSSWSWAEPFERRGQVTLLDPVGMSQAFCDLRFIDEVDQYSYTLGSKPPIHLWVGSARRL